MSLQHQIVPAAKPRKPKQEAPGVGHNAAPNWKGYAEELDALNDSIANLQGQKKKIYADLRDVRGKVAADALKTAMRIRGMKAEKRQHSEQVDSLTFEILHSLENGVDKAPDVEHARRAPREGTALEPTRAPSSTPPHDPETGEITEIGSQGSPPDGETAPAGRAADEAPVPIQEKPKDAGPFPASLDRRKQATA